MEAQPPIESNVTSQRDQSKGIISTGEGHSGPASAERPETERNTGQSSPVESQNKIEPRPWSEDGQTKSWARTEQLLRKDYVNPDIEAVKIICASVAAHRITAHFPAWLMCVAPSGSLKTAILESLNGLPGVHFIDRNPSVRHEKFRGRGCEIGAEG